MAITTTTRMGLTRWSADSDAQWRAQFDGNFAAIDTSAAMYAQGSLAARPSPGKAGRWYAVTTGPGAGTLHYDTGSAWLQTAMAAATDMTLAWAKHSTIPTDPGSSWAKVAYPAPGEALVDVKLTAAGDEATNYRWTLTGLPAPVGDVALPMHVRTAAGAVNVLTLVCASGLWWAVPQGLSTAVGHVDPVSLGDTLWASGVYRTA